MTRNTKVRSEHADQGSPADDHNPVAIKRDGALLFQGLERAADHLAGRSHNGRHLLLRGLLLQAETSLAVIFSHLQEVLRHTAGHAEERQVLDLTGKVAELPSKRLKKTYRNGRVRFDQTPHRFPPDTPQRRRLHCLGVSRIRSAIEDRDLIETVAGLGSPKDLLTPVS